MDTAQDRALETMTFVCTPMRARISRRQCGVNIKTGLIPHCKTCPERTSADKTAPVNRFAWDHPYKGETHHA
jgi:hypothetical protein